MQITQHAQTMSCNHDNEGQNEHRLCIGLFSDCKINPTIFEYAGFNINATSA
ncbi:UNVERIFIED_CONTAM: hypothetical protein FKN15_024142 [Acipenser sinensis]